MSRISSRDRFYATVDVAKVIGPLDPVEPEAVRATLRAMHAARPDAKALSRLDHRAGRWRTMTTREFAAWSEDLVVELDPADDADKVAARLMSEHLGSRPLVFGAGGRYAGFRFNHALGDGRVAAPLFINAMSGSGGYPVAASARAPMLRAVAHHLLRRPSRLVEVARTVRPAAPRGDSRHRPWAPALAHHWAASTPDGSARLRAWRKRHASGASIGAVLAAAVSAAFTRHLSAPERPGLMMLVDARRYLPSGLPVDGNFSGAQFLAPADPCNARQVHDLMSHRLRTGHPLAAIGMHNLRLLATRPARTEDTVAVDARPRLTLTYLGRSDAYGILPFSGGPGERAMIDVVGTDGPQGITVAVEEFGGVVHATTTFHSNVFDAGAVAAATAAVVGDLTGLLPGAGD